MEDPNAPIQFFTEDIAFELPKPEQFQQWIEQVAHHYDYKIEAITYIFCSDQYLHEINVSYLDHDTYTDIITFDNSEEEGLIESDIFISVDRVKENAKSFEVTFEEELKRVMIHGLLHLVGYGDKTDEEKQLMRAEESLWVQRF